VVTFTFPFGLSIFVGGTTRFLAGAMSSLPRVDDSSPATSNGLVAYGDGKAVGNGCRCNESIGRFGRQASSVGFGHVALAPGWMG